MDNHAFKMTTRTRQLTSAAARTSLALLVYVALYFLLFDRSLPAFRKSRPTPSFHSSFRWAKNIRYNDSDVTTFVRGVHVLNYLFYPMDVIFGKGGKRGDRLEILLIFQ